MLTLAKRIYNEYIRLFLPTHILLSPAFSLSFSSHLISSFFVFQEESKAINMNVVIPIIIIDIRIITALAKLIAIWI